MAKSFRPRLARVETESLESHGSHAAFLPDALRSIHAECDGQVVTIGAVGAVDAKLVSGVFPGEPRKTASNVLRT